MLWSDTFAVATFAVSVKYAITIRMHSAVLGLLSARSHCCKHTELTAGPT